MKKRTSIFNKPYIESVQEIVEYFTPPKYEKTPDQLDRIIAVLNKSFLTRHLSQQDLNILAHAMQEKRYTEGDIIIKYGDLGHEYYILDQGEVQIIVYNDGVSPDDAELDQKIKLTKIINTAIGFGEIALLYNDKRTATVKASKNSSCWVLEGTTFKNIIIKQSIKRQTIDPSFLERVDLFNKMDKYDKLKLLEMMNTKVFLRGDYIFREGDDGDNFYMIVEGEVECVKNKQTVSTTHEGI